MNCVVLCIVLKCVVLCIVFSIVLFCVFFVCKYVLYYCQWVSAQLQLNISYLSYHIISRSKVRDYGVAIQRNYIFTYYILDLFKYCFLYDRLCNENGAIFVNGEMKGCGSCL